jgi:hypothetical protein
MVMTEVRMSRRRVGMIWGWGLSVALSSGGLACQSGGSASGAAATPAPEAEASSAAAGESSPEAAGSPSARAAQGAPRIAPEPEDIPCKNCSVDVLGRLRGSIREVDKCGPTGDPVRYPVKLHVLEVVSGEQSGQQFQLLEVADSYAPGDALEARLPEDADPKGWEEAKLMVEDADGQVCPSAVRLDK